MQNKQLFSLVRSVELPIRAQFNPMTGNFQGMNEVVDAVFAVYWPNGRPCVYAEMFLLQKGEHLKLRTEDGGSLKVTAADLSQLVRFCWENKRDFWDLYDDDFYLFVQGLRCEMKHPGSAVRRRNDNTVGRIIETALEFLFWLQTRISLERKIVGPRRIAPQIRLVEKSHRNHWGGSSVRLTYPFTPTSDATDPKRPMSSIVRNQLWDGVSNLAEKTQPNLQQAERSYLRARRELSLLLFEATGCRPGEAALLSVKDNENCVSTGLITLTTLKRRKTTDPKRRIPLDKGTAIKLEVFIHKYRHGLLKRLRAQGVEVSPEDKVFLGCRHGEPLTAASLIREFQRIACAAGVEQRACASMFRHRFVTNMVKLHLLALMQDHPGATRALLTEGDYRTILKRVGTFTGHGSEESLWHYIDWAWEELEVFDYVNSARELSRSVESAMCGLKALSGRVRSSNVGEVMQEVLIELENILATTNEALRN